MSILLRQITISWGFLVVSAWILSFLNQLNWWNFRWIVLITLVANVSLLVRQRPDLRSKLKSLRSQSWPTKFTIAAVVSAWGYFFVYSLTKLALLPPNNWDSMTYHLANLARTSQSGNIGYDPTVLVSRVNSATVNGGILNLGSYSMFGSENLIELPQLIAAILIPCFLYYIGRNLFGFSLKTSFLATLIPLTIPLYWLVSITTQTEIYVVFGFLLAVIAVYKYKESGRTRDLVIALIACALLFGSKYHAMLLVAPLGLMLLWSVFRTHKYRLTKKRSLVLGATLIGAILIAFPKFIISQIHYGSFLYEPSVATKFRVGVETLHANIIHFGSWFFTSPTYDAEYFSHDTSHFGVWFMLMAIFMLSVLGYFLYQRKWSYNLVLLPVLFFAGIFLTFHYPDPWDLRLFFIAPFVLLWLSTAYLLESPRKLIVLTIATFLLVFSAHTGYRILKNDFSDIGKFREGVREYRKGSEYTIGEYYAGRMNSLLEFEKAIAEVETPTSILVTGHGDTWLYPYYGSGWENQVYFEKDLSKTIKMSETGDYDFISVTITMEDREDLDTPEWLEIVGVDDMRIIYKYIGS